MKRIDFFKGNVITIIVMLLAIGLLTYTISQPKGRFAKKERITIDTSKYEMVSVKVPMHKFKSSDLYKKNCRFCHGAYGKGDGVKARVDSTLCPYDLSKEQKNDTLVYWAIANGQNRMPSHEEKLSDTNIHVLVIYIKRFKTN